MTNETTKETLKNIKLFKIERARDLIEEAANLIGEYGEVELSKKIWSIEKEISGEIDFTFKGIIPIDTEEEEETKLIFTVAKESSLPKLETIVKAFLEERGNVDYKIIEDDYRNVIFDNVFSEDEIRVFLYLISRNLGNYTMKPGELDYLALVGYGDDTGEFTETGGLALDLNGKIVEIN